MVPWELPSLGLCVSVTLWGEDGGLDQDRQPQMHFSGPSALTLPTYDQENLRHSQALRVCHWGPSSIPAPRVPTLSLSDTCPRSDTFAECMNDELRGVSEAEYDFCAGRQAGGSPVDGWQVFKRGRWLLQGWGWQHQVSAACAGLAHEHVQQAPLERPSLPGALPSRVHVDLGQ